MRIQDHIVNAIVIGLRRLRRRSTLGHTLVLMGFLIVVAAVNFAVRFLIGQDLQFTLELIAVLTISFPFVMISHIALQYAYTMEDQLRENAMQDSLTKLNNRCSFIDQIEQLQKNGIGGMLVLVDADHFKRINDSYGHHIGDLALEQTAAHLRDFTRDTDLRGRLGGEEFGLFLPGPLRTLCADRWDRLCNGIVINAGGMPVNVTFSAGAAYLEPGSTYEATFKIADAALYRAKQKGRNRLECAPGTMIISKRLQDHSHSSAPFFHS